MKTSNTIWKKVSIIEPYPGCKTATSSKGMEIIYACIFSLPHRHSFPLYTSATAGDSIAMVLHANTSPVHPTWPSSTCYRNLSHNPFTSDLNPLEEQSSSCNLKLLVHQYFETDSRSLMQTWCLDPHFDLIFTSTTSRILHKQTTDLICILISLCPHTNPLYSGIILHANQCWKESNPLMDMRRSENVLDIHKQLLIRPYHAHPHFWSDQQANWQKK